MFIENIAQNERKSFSKNLSEKKWWLPK